MQPPLTSWVSDSLLDQSLPPGASEWRRCGHSTWGRVSRPPSIHAPSVGYGTLSSFRGASITPLTVHVLWVGLWPRLWDTSASHPPGPKAGAIRVNPRTSAVSGRDSAFLPKPGRCGWQCCRHLIIKGTSVSGKSQHRSRRAKSWRNIDVPTAQFEAWSRTSQFLESTAFLVGLTYVRFSVICKKSPSFQILFC